MRIIYNKNKNMQTKINNDLIENNLLNTDIKSAYYILNKKE